VNLRYFIAQRYLFSKKSTHVINVISGITALGIALGTMALVVILSVFNGLESLIVNRFNSFDSDLKIQPVIGKTFIPDSTTLKLLNETPGVSRFSEIIEENALIRYEESYHPFTIKGVSPTYAAITGIDTMMINGRFMLEYQGSPVAVVGMEVSSYLSVSLNFISPLRIYVPDRTSGFTDNPEKAFKIKNIYPVGIYSIDPDINQYVIVPISFARELLEYKKEVSAIEIQFNKGANETTVKRAIKKIFGTAFSIKNRYEQHETLYRIMKSEKVIVFLILAFILLIASFNVIGSLTMLIIEKKEDVVTFRSLGMSITEIRKLFLLEGWLISVFGALAGLAMGALFCVLQQKYGFIPMQGSSPNSFIVNSYPVDMRILDFIMSLVTVLIIGYIASRFPVRYITRKYMTESISKTKL
jgi:lipoprotein-releasing system permease protein